MPETPETAGDVQEIRYRLEAIEATQRLLVRADLDDLLASYLAIFSNDALLRDIYLLLDGRRKQIDIVSAMKADGKRTTNFSVSKKMEILRANGLVGLVPTDSQGKVYEKNRIVEEILQLSKKL